MMSALTRKLDEVRRLQELHQLYKDSDDILLRRKSHIDLDKFLMENRETAIMCMERVLSDEIQALVEANKQPRTKRAWLGKFKLWRMPLRSTKETN